MSRILTEYRDPDPSPRWTIADILVREEPEDEDDEDDEDDEKNNDDEEDDDGYSE